MFPRIAFCLFFISFFYIADAQQFLYSDDLLPLGAEDIAVPTRITDTDPDTLSVSAGNPFMDDFYYGGILPDSNKWFLTGSIRYPNLTQNISIHPPTQGTATFDGINASGKAYSPIAQSGITDVLESHYLNLANYSPTSNVYLSFALQPQG